MSRLVVQGARPFPPSSCAICREPFGPLDRKRVAGRRLVHPACAEHRCELVACSVCQRVLFERIQLDASCRCDDCRP